MCLLAAGHIIKESKECVVNSKRVLVTLDTVIFPVDIRGLIS